MQHKLLVVLVFIFVLSGPKLVHAQVGENAPQEENFTVTKDVAYTQGAQGPLLADVYIPTGAGVFPGIIFIHGGGWRNGNRNQMVKLIKAMAEAGYICFTIEYDVDPVHFPASFHESIAALKFFREHAGEYHLDRAHVAVAGSSAGGELAALLALNPEGTPFDAASGKAAAKAKKGTASGVQAALILNGVLDLTVGDDKSGTVADYLGGPCASLLQVCKDASPLFHVHAGAPPFYVGHGTEDQAVPFTEATAFIDALKRAEVPVVFFKAEGGKHTYWADPRFYSENLDAMKVFLAHNLQASGGGKAKKE